MKNVRIRVQGILEKDGKLLLIMHKKGNKKYWLLPGGGVDYGETFESSLKREFIEEVGLEIEVGKLAFVSESIAPDLRRHIVNMYFEVKEVGGKLILGDEKILEDVKYIDIEKLEEITLYPNLKKELKDYFVKEDKEFKFLGNRWED